MGYREYAPPAKLSELVEVAWVMDGPPAPVRVLPDGCMDLIAMDDGIVVAGPDTAPVETTRATETPTSACGFAQASCPGCSASQQGNCATAGCRFRTYDRCRGRSR